MHFHVFSQNPSLRKPMNFIGCQPLRSHIICMIQPKTHLGISEGQDYFITLSASFVKIIGKQITITMCPAMLTHWERVTHICVSKLNIIGLDMMKWWNIVNWTLRNKFQWNFNRNSNIFIQENALENVICEMASILSRPQCVKWETPYSVNVRHYIAVYITYQIYSFHRTFEHIVIHIYVVQFKISQRLCVLQIHEK